MNARPCNIVITGASGGLGAALAALYAAPGTRLGLIGRNAERLAAVAARCRALGATVETGIVDVSDGPALSRWLLAVDAARPVDLLIANAGVSSGFDRDAITEGSQAVMRQISINLSGSIQAVETLAPLMCARRQGHVAMVASIAAFKGLPDSPGYCASKAGLYAYGESIRPLLHPYGVQVSVICPGFFDSAMSRRFEGPKPFLVTAERAAVIVKRGLDRRRGRIVFPLVLGLLLKLADLLPAAWTDAVIRRYRFAIEPGAAK